MPNITRWRFVVAVSGECRLEVRSYGRWNSYRIDEDPYDVAAQLRDNGILQNPTVFHSEFDAAEVACA